MTSLHISSEYAEAKDIVSALATASCDVNARNKLGRTALHLAAKLGNTENVNMLLDAGCDRNIKDKLGFTAVGLAFKFNQKRSADILLHYKPRRNRSSSKESVLDENQNEPDVERKSLKREATDVKDDLCTEAGANTPNVAQITLKQSKLGQFQFQELCSKMFLKFTNRKVMKETLSWKINHLIVATLTRKRDKLDGIACSHSRKTCYMETAIFERKLLNTILVSSLIQYPFPVNAVTTFDTRLRKRCLCKLKTHNVFTESVPHNLESDILVKLLKDLKESLFCSRNPSRNPSASLPVDTEPENFGVFTQMLKRLYNCRSDESTLQKALTENDAEIHEGNLRKPMIILITRDSEGKRHELPQIETDFLMDKVGNFLSCLDCVINTKSGPASFVEDLLEFFLQNSNIFIFCLKCRGSMFSKILNKYLSDNSPWIADKIAQLFLQVCVALVNEHRLLLKCAGIVMKQGLSHKHCNVVSLGTCILVRMGLLKGEYDADTILDLKGPLLALEYVFAEEYFPRDLASIFASFLCKSSPKLFGLEKLRLQALTSAVTREILPTSAQEAESDLGKSFKRICDIVALEEDWELLSKCLDALCLRAFVTFDCKVWSTGESLLIYLGLLKSEFSVEIVRNLKCALKLVLRVVKKSYCPQELKQVFLCFLQKPNPALNSCCSEVDEILSTLFNQESNL